LGKLQEILHKEEWTSESTAEYESLDSVITESMLSAEKELGKRITTTYQWSPRLKQAVQRLRYWQLWLCQVRNQPVSINQLLRYQQEGNISVEDQQLLSEPDTKNAQHQAYLNLKALQKQHQELRDTYLEDLADAIVLDRSPNLADEAMEAIRVERCEKQLKRLISREKLRKMYRKIGCTLNKLGGKGLSRIDVPDASAATEGSGDPEDPKTWKGPWKSVTNPVDIAKEVCKVSARQYHQAHGTPFGSGPVADLVGRRGDTPSSAALLQGSLPIGLPTSIKPETFRVLQTLATPVPNVTGNVAITLDEFRSTYKVAQENTSSSPSGREGYLKRSKPSSATLPNDVYALSRWFCTAALD
jgi:hypothetical protein